MTVPGRKLLSGGCSALSDAELIAILIGSGNRSESAVELARAYSDLLKTVCTAGQAGRKGTHAVPGYRHGKGSGCCCCP
jgi:hypothetical protein